MRCAAGRRRACRVGERVRRARSGRGRAARPPPGGGGPGWLRLRVSEAYLAWRGLCGGACCAAPDSKRGVWGSSRERSLWAGLAHGSELRVTYGCGWLCASAAPCSAPGRMAAPSAWWQRQDVHRRRRSAGRARRLGECCVRRGAGRASPAVPGAPAMLSSGAQLAQCGQASKQRVSFLLAPGKVGPSVLCAVGYVHA